MTLKDQIAELKRLVKKLQAKLRDKGLPDVQLHHAVPNHPTFGIETSSNQIQEK